MAWVYALGALATVAAILALTYRPLGDYMARVFLSEDDSRVEAAFYRLVGVDPRAGQSWRAYLRAVLAFSAVGFVLLYLLQRLQAFLPYSLGLGAPSEHLAFNTAASFVTNTNWQSYSPESTLGYTVQFAGLAVQNFVSAAVGLAVAVALVRGLAAKKGGSLGNFWVDTTRATLRILLPLSFAAALVLVALGVVQNFDGFSQVSTLAGGQQQIPGGPVASQEAIKLLGTNGGGFFNANSAHPFENPSAWSNLVEIVLMLLIPFALPRTFGTMVGDRRQGLAVAGVMSALFVAAFAAMTYFELRGAGGATELAGAALEGKEQRLGIAGSTLFSTASTGTSTGAVASMHDSFTALGGLVPMLSMMLGEIAPGGVGSGLYGILVLAVLAVFVSGLLIGRTPEYLGKRIGPREIKLASLYILITPTLVLAGTALSLGLPGVGDSVRESLGNDGLHGTSEILYAFTSAANNNGSAFAGLTANTPWLNTALGVVMLLGRFLPIALVLALADAFARQGRAPETAGTLPTHRPLFAGILGVVAVLVSALTFFPALTLGPLAEGLI
ncbi:potassium-transporting ATPase subunit KdpA [Dietzia sp.]|uniref:potassium-transporting ATPase subunit KdpA n=1 Tax=Dietzia sp. TaxID=1871616 RepID=UPI002FDB6CD5